MEAKASEYKNLGCVNGWNESPQEYKDCVDACHTREEIALGRCYHKKVCHTCKIYWTIDSSD